MGPLQLKVRLYKIHHARKQATFNLLCYWDNGIQTKENSSRIEWSRFVLDAPGCNLLSTIANSVPCNH